VPQGIQDPVGDVRDLDGGVAEGPFAALGDIESVSLELQSDALVLLINTAEGAPTALPEGVDSLSFVLELKIDQDTDYIVAMSQAMGFPSWLVSVTDFASGATELVDAGATATGDTLRCAVPLASMPGFAPSFKWRVDATWATATAAWDDEVPERGADILNPALLDFPY
jgi:hypothetical protein